MKTSTVHCRKAALCLRIVYRAPIKPSKAAIKYKSHRVSISTDVDCLSSSGFEVGGDVDDGDFEFENNLSKNDSI